MLNYMLFVKSAMSGKEMMDKLSITCGYRSNIPICCIIFFETIWGKLIYPNTRLYNNYMIFHRQQKGYVHCPICIILKRSREIIDCDNNPNKPCNPCENKNDENN